MLVTREKLSAARRPKRMSFMAFWQAADSGVKARGF